MVREQSTIASVHSGITTACDANGKRLIVRTFKAEDIAEILKNVQEKQKHVKNYDNAKELEKHDAFTVEFDGRIAACIGVVHVWGHRGFAWSILSKQASLCMWQLTKGIRRYFAICPYDRIECYVDPEFENAKQWMRMLGFKREGYMSKFYPDGKDALLYARVK